MPAKKIPATPVPTQPNGSKNAAKCVGVIGLGIVGSRVAECCRQAGFNVCLWNRTARKTPGFVNSPAEVAHRARIVQIFVSDGAALLDVIAAMMPRLTPEHIVINCSTVSLDATLAAANEVAEVDASFLDCPFTGSKGAAEAGQLVYYVGGSPSVLKRAEKILAASAKAILPVGEIGDATVLKIATNMISATTVEILAEAMGLVAAHGIDLQRFAEALENNACASGLTRMKVPSILNRDFAPHFSLKNMLKDARIAKQMAESKGLELPALSVAAQRMAALNGKGRGDDDYSVLAVNYLPGSTRES